MRLVLCLSVSIGLCLLGGIAKADMVYTDRYGKTITQQQYQALKLVDQGAVFLHEGKNQEFLAETEKAMAMAPELALVQAGYGTALGSLGRYNEAREHLEKSLSIDDNNPKAWCALAAIHTTLGHNAEALKCYRTFLSKFPNDQNASKIKSVVAILTEGIAATANDSGPDYYDSACGAHPYKWPRRSNAD